MPIWCRLESMSIKKSCHIYYRNGLTGWGQYIPVHKVLRHLEQDCCNNCQILHTSIRKNTPAAQMSLSQEQV